MFLQLLSSFLFVIGSVVTLHLFILTIAGFFRKKTDSISAVRSRKTVVFITGNNPTLIEHRINELNKLNYPAGHLTIAVIQGSDRHHHSIRRENNVVYASSHNPVQIFRQLVDELNGAFEIAVFISDQQSPGSNFLQAVNDTFQAGHSFIRFQSSLKNNAVPAGDLLRKQLAEGGFSALKISVPLDGYGFALPYLWVKQHVSEMEDQNGLIEGFQRMLGRENQKVLLAGDRVQLLSSAAALKRTRFSIMASVVCLVRGLFQTFRGRPGLLMSSIWHLQSGFMMTAMFLLVVSLLSAKGFLLMGCYLCCVTMLMLQNKNIRSGAVFRASIHGNKKHLRLILRKMRTARVAGITQPA